ncbi:MAG: SDR family oxidoreductase [Thermoleophilia bacterium]|nr:SDR family oxidoreductase [Thermoleophilia bacterium]
MSSAVAGKVVALTGGARGIGHETVKLLAAVGAKVGVGDLDLSLVEDSLAEVPGETAGFVVDVTSRDSFQTFIDDVEQRLGPIDVLINNAGVMSLSPLTDEPDEISDRMLDINLRGPMLGMKIVIPRMLARQNGHVITIVSSAGRFGVAGAAMYSASKFGAYGLTESAASEYANTPLHFSAICPVVVRTELTSGVTGRTRGAPTLEPQDVARAVLKTIEKPRMQVFVPGSVRFMHLLSQVLPRRLRRLAERASGADTLLVDIDRDARAHYNRRAFGEPKDLAKKS